MRRLALAGVVAAMSASGAFAQTPDLEAGATSFKKCTACHRVGEGAKNLVGPELNGLDGRKAGTVEGFKYSDANKDSGITWNAEVFREYIKNPKAKIPGTKMIFAGIKVSEDAEKAKTDEITNLWAYLAQYDASGKIKEKK